MRCRSLCVLAALASFGAAAAVSVSPVLAGDAKSAGIDPVPADPKANNPWPANWEAQFWDRSAHAKDFWKGKKPGGGTFGENEKNYYPTAMWAYLTGDTKTAVKIFEEPDNLKADSGYTNDVDFYWCFTLKGQMRKYFYFGKQLGALSPEYMARFKDGATKWVATDPLETPHPVHGKGSGAKEGWGPEVKGRRVDGRNTDNLRAMRDTSVYLMAEETGNEEMRQKYKAKLARYVATLYNVGMSEWDSPNYHSHTLAPYHNLYDFAKDPEVKALAKAALDWLYAAGAVKYFHGGFAAPNARNYGGNIVFIQNVVDPLWLYFGDTPVDPPGSDRDDVHHVTSSYRPPAAVVELAHKNVQRPVELFASKPPYRNWQGGEQPPEFFETTYIANTYQLGTCVSEGTGGAWNISAFGLVAQNSKRGADYVVANTDSILGQMFKREGDQVAQYRNLAIWLRPAAPAKTLYWQVPQTAKIEVRDGVTFLALENTWLAIRPINLGSMQTKSPVDVVDPKKKEETAKAYGGEQILAFETTGDTYAGFAMEVGEPQSHGSYDAFVRDVLAKGKLDVTKLKAGTATLTGVDGKTLSITHNDRNELPAVARDGKPVDFKQQTDVYTSPFIAQKYLGGTLRVEAGGKVFEGTYDEKKGYTFTNK